MSIVMVSSKTKEEILSAIQEKLVKENSTPEVLAKVKIEAESVVKTSEEKKAAFDAMVEKVKAMELEDDETEMLIAKKAEKLGFPVGSVVPTTEQVVEWKMTQLVSPETVVEVYKTWATIFGMEEKAARGRPAAGSKENGEARFGNVWARELTNKVQAVNFRVLTDEQKQKYNLTNAGQWVLKHGDKTLVIVADYPNNVVVGSKTLLGQSLSGINNSMWNDGQNLSASEIASF